MEMVVSTKLVIRTLVVFMAVLIVLHLASYIPVINGDRDGPINLINMDGEQNISALFSTTLLWMCAALTWFIARAISDQISRQKWMGLSVIFLFLGLDESLSLHERLSGIVNNTLPVLQMASFAWLLPYAVVLLFLSFIYVKLWWQLPSAVRWRVLIGGALFVAGGMGCEFLGWLWTRANGADIVYLVEILLEEVLEMSGVIVLISAFLNFIGLLSPNIRMTITTKSACVPE